MMILKTVNDSVGNFAGAASAAGGIVTAANEAAGGGILPFLNANAGALGVIFTAATFFVYLVSRIISGWIELREHRKRMAAIQPPPNSPPQP